MAGGPLEAVTPHLTQRRRYQPEVGHKITIDFPGERSRAEIKRVFNQDNVVVELLAAPVGKGGTNYTKGEILVCRRGFNETLGVETWNVVTDRKLDEEAAIARLEQEEHERIAKEEQDRVAALQAAEAARIAAAAVPHGTPTDEELAREDEILQQAAEIRKRRRTAEKAA